MGQQAKRLAAVRPWRTEFAQGMRTKTAVRPRVALRREGKRTKTKNAIRRLL